MKKIIIYQSLIFLMVLASKSFVIAQTQGISANQQRDDNPILLEKIKKAVSQKEQKFKLTIGTSTKETGRKVLFIIWKLYEDYVQVQINDEEKVTSAEYLIDVNTGKLGPTNNTCKYARLAELGEEAYFCSDNSNNRKFNQILMRKGGAYVVVHATSPSVAKRFASYVMREIEKRDNGN